MAGITNPGFRRLCREQGAGFYVCEMITSRGLVERNPLTFRMIAFDPDEQPRSMQLYGVDPATIGSAVRMIAERDLADHVDLNFGCPVPKVTRRGGGAALPYKRRLFDAIVRAAVDNAGRIPITVKMRIGIDDEHQTYLDAGQRAADAGVAAVALHARTAAAPTLRQRHQAGQEAGQRFARAGGGDQQRRTTGRHLVEQPELVLARAPTTRLEPAAEHRRQRAGRYPDTQRGARFRPAQQAWFGPAAHWGARGGFGLLRLRRLC